MNNTSQPEDSSGLSDEKSGHELVLRRSSESASGPESSDKENSESNSPGRVRITSERGTGQPAQRLLFTPTIDIFNTDEGLVLRADLPGVCVERLDLQIEDNKLTLFGRVQENLPKEARLLHREYQVGDFYRSFILSDEVAYDRITAKMNSGVLEITLPRIPRAQPRKIHVQTE